MNASRSIQTEFLTLIKSKDTFLALFTGDPTQDGSGGIEQTNALTGSMNRTAVSFGPIIQETVGSKVVMDTVTITNAASNVVNITIDHFAVFDAETGGELLWFQELDPVINVSNGNTLQVDPSAIQILVR